MYEYVACFLVLRSVYRFEVSAGRSVIRAMAATQQTQTIANAIGLQVQGRVHHMVEVPVPADGLCAFYLAAAAQDIAAWCLSLQRDTVTHRCA